MSNSKNNQKNQNQKPQTTQPQQPPQAAQPPVEPQASANATQPQQPPQAAQPPVDKATYDKYIGLKFTELSGAKLKDEAKKEMNSLEAELKQCSGAIPVRTVTAAISNEIVKMVAGVPMPEDYAKIIRNSSNPAYYIGE